MNKNKESNLLKAHTWETLLVILLLLPALIQTNFLYVGTWLLNFIHIGKPANWLGFWGSYLGSIFAIIFAYENTKIQLKKNKENDIDNYKIDKLANLMAIIIKRRNEYERSKSIAENLKKMFEDPNSYVSDKMIKEISYKKLMELEESHVSDWNKNFVIFDDEDPYIKDIKEKWKKISNLIDNYQEISTNLSSIQKHPDSMGKFKNEPYVNEPYVTEAIKQLKKMEDTCIDIYDKLHDMCNSLMR